MHTLSLTPIYDGYKAYLHPGLQIDIHSAVKLIALLPQLKVLQLHDINFSIPNTPFPTFPQSLQTF